MKSLRQLLAYSLLAFSLGACQTDKEEVAPEAFTGTWRLEAIAGGGTGQTSATADLGYEQYYTLLDDNTFRKFRSTGAIVTGNYTLEKIEDKLYAVLEVKEHLYHDDFMPLGVSCTQNRMYLYLEGGKLHDNNMACDIGNYIYKKTTTTK